MNIKNHINFARKIGYIEYFKGITEFIKNIIFQKIFKFDKWHVFGYYFRPYKSQVVSIINSLAVENIVEIGCGLADILKRCNAPLKIGIDIDKGAIKAAKFLSHNNLHFYAGDINDTTQILGQSKLLKSIDLLVMINWLHELPFTEIHKSVNTINQQFQIKFILVDTITNKNSHGYQHYHDISNFTKIGKIIKTFEAIDGIRNYILITPDLKNF